MVLHVEYGTGRRTQTLRQKAKTSPAAKTIPNPRTAIATGSYAGINIVGPSMAPTPTPEIVTEQKFRKFGFRSVNYPFRMGPRPPSASSAPASGGMRHCF